MGSPRAGQYLTMTGVEAMEYRVGFEVDLIRFAGTARVWARPGSAELVVFTRIGEVRCWPGDFVVRDRNGHLTVESASDFRELYAPVGDAHMLSPDVR